MSGVLSVLGFVALVVGLVGIAKGSLTTLGLASRKACTVFTLAALAVMGAAGSAGSKSTNPPAKAASSAAASDVASPEPPATAAPEPSASPASPSAPQSSPAASAAPASFGPLLVMAADGDGDSWKDTQGVAYRMGLINAPEVGECGGATATAFRKRRLANGFYARAYSTDTYGRRVAVIYTRTRTNLNVEMARLGIANDRYLASFRHENPSLARQLDAAFAEAKAAHRGIWSSCTSRPTTTSGFVGTTAAPQTSGCHPDYQTCIPIKGDGSGAGAANDLDCGDIGKKVYLRVPGRDPYRLDANGDGAGCESYG